MAHFLSCCVPLCEYTAMYSSSFLLIDICIIFGSFSTNNAAVILFIDVSLYMYKHF